MTRKEVLDRLAAQGFLKQDDYIRLISHEEERQKAEHMKGCFAGSDYVSLTELAKKHNYTSAAEVIHTWIRHRTTIAFLSKWEQINNPSFRPLPDEKRNAVTPKRWIKETGAVGMRYKQGHHGGVWAHPEIACDFLMWLSSSFRAEVIAVSCRAVAEATR